MKTEDVSTLKIHKLTQAQYDRELEAGNIDENALYLTPDEEIDLTPYATKDELNDYVDDLIATKPGEIYDTNGAEIFNDYVENAASGNYSHAEGSNTMASGNYSHAEGYNTIAFNYQSVVGKHNKQTSAPSSLTDTTASTGIFIVGVGTSSSTLNNGFRVNAAGRPYALSSMATSGADYAEYFEWIDGNPTDEDRRGRFVTLDGRKIRYATANDDYILGVISAEPTIVGDIQSETWHNMYLKDVYGERLVDIVEVEETVDEYGKIIPAHIERRWVLNPDYDQNKEYLSREERPEWDAVGIVGKLVAVDDGTCIVNGYCCPNVDGIATATEKRTAYRVMERLDDTHVRIFIK